MNRYLAGLVVILLAAAYGGGYVPERQKRIDAEARLATAEGRATAAEGRIRLGEVLGRLLRLRDALQSQNFGQAATLSSAFFDSVRDEAAKTSAPDVRAALERIQQTRDAVTTQIARADASVVSVVNEQETALRQALGYAVEGPPAR